MNRSHHLTLFGCLLILAVAARALSAPITAAKPPMGWDSFDCYGVYLNEKEAMANLEAMARVLKPSGYKYFIVDNGWFGEYKLLPDGYPAEKFAHDVRLNKYGLYLPSKMLFPHGFKPLVKRCHELGLKFGVHLMRGIPRKAYKENLPIKGTPYHARDIADTNAADNCTWCKYNYGVDMTKPGAQAWYDSVVRHVVDMGAQYIKYDDMVSHPAEIEAVVRAIAKTGQPVVLSLSPGNKVDPKAFATYCKANMLRVTPDIWDDMTGIDQAFAAWHKWSGYERPGFWIDLGMIPFGQLQLMSPPHNTASDKRTVALTGRGSIRWCRFSLPQMETFITIRALAASPLIVGGDLVTLDAVSLRLLTEPEMIACDQNGVMGHLVNETNGIEVWLAPKQNTQGKRGWIGVFNRTPAEKNVAISKDMLGLTTAKDVRLTDIWKGQRIYNLHGKEKIVATIAPDGVLFFVFK